MAQSVLDKLMAGLGGGAAAKQAAQVPRLLDFSGQQAAAPVATPTAVAPGPQSLLQRLGIPIDFASPGNQVALQFLANAAPSTESGRTFNGIPEAAQNAQVMQMRQQQAETDAAAAEEEKARRAEISKYALQIVPDNLKSLAAVDPESALKIYEQMQPAQQAMTADMQNYQFAQQNPDFAQFVNPPQPGYRPMTPQDRAAFGIPETDKRAYVVGPDNKPEPVGGNSTQTPMNATIQKELFETEDAINAGGAILSTLDTAIALNDKAYDGPAADIRGGAGGWLGVPGAQETQLLDNLSKELALNQLKSIFGAAPTEGERKILLDLQGSVNQPKEVRAQIYARARAAAERRLAIAQQKAAGLRSGDYFSTDFGAQQPAAGDPATLSDDELLQQLGM